MNMMDIRSESIKRKFPRLFLAAAGGSAAPLQDVALAWPERTVSPVLDMSESGLVVSAAGSLSQRKPGQVLQVRLRVAGSDPQPLTVKVLRVTAGAFFLALESLTPAGRIRIGQEDRENLIRSSWRALSPVSLHPHFHNSQWWHSVFDTDVWVWRDSAGVAEKIIVEFESVALVYDAAGSRFLKSPSSLDESRGYVGAFMDPLPNKVEPGHNWGERLQKVLSEPLPPELGAEIRPLLPRSLVKGLHV